VDVGGFLNCNSLRETSPSKAITFFFQPITKLSPWAKLLLPPSRMVLYSLIRKILPEYHPDNLQTSNNSSFLGNIPLKKKRKQKLETYNSSLENIHMLSKNLLYDSQFC
jgi:hypothetical protein